MKRQLIISSLCLVLLLVMMLSTTLAWFTDSKGYVNTMVAGKISISQEETFEQDTIIMPNVSITKNVVVTNTGNLPCYVRTLFAFEDSNTVDVLKLINVDDSGIDANGGIVIDGITNNEPKVQFTVTRGTEVTTYTVGYYTHPNQLAIGGTINPLTAIKLDGTAGNTWHEAVGEKYELFVLSQASQVEGLSDDPAIALNTAFAPITGDWCATWFARVLGGEATGSNITIATTNP